MPTYAKPPIVEAIVEIRIASMAAEDAIKGIEATFKKKYPRVEHQQAVTVAITPTGSTSSARFEALRFSKLDQSEIAVIRRSSFSRSMLPPYQGFQAFKTSIMDDWTACRPVYRGCTISRIGTRYLNRIDIPTHGQSSLNLIDYVRISVALPDFGYGPLIGQSLNAALPLGDARKTANLNFATVPSALIDHLALLVDIEVFQDKDLPQQTTEIFEDLDDFQHYKNELFERIITDRTRELIRT